MFAANHQTHGDPPQPYVAMTEAEALALAGELERIVNHAFATGTARQQVLAFFKAHCKAWGITSEVMR